MISTQAVEHSLKFIPYVWGSFDRERRDENPKASMKFLSEPHTLEANHEARINIPAIQNKEEGNYILLRAYAKGDKDTDIILNYGTKNRKEGGFIFTIKHGQGPLDYKVRVSSQYNWSSNNIEWISLYSIGSAVQLEQVEIEKGD